MATLTIDLPSQEARVSFNRRRWSEIVQDRELARIEGRVETDRHGHVIMSPPPAPLHGRLQARIAYLLGTLMNDGCALTECPISTADGVKAADVAWVSGDMLAAVQSEVCLSKAPAICVEIISPNNSESEILEKRDLYFDAGAREVWLCSSFGEMTFFVAANPDSARQSLLCSKFPVKI